MQHPRCTLQLLKKHVDRYTPGDGGEDLRHPQDKFSRWPRWFTSTGNAQRVGTITYALGWTQHFRRRADHPHRGHAAALAGQRGPAGWRRQRAARHSNIQGATDIGGTFEILPGYLATPRAISPICTTYLKGVTRPR